MLSDDTSDGETTSSIDHSITLNPNETNGDHSSVSGGDVTSSREGSTFNNETTLTLGHCSDPNLGLSMQEFLSTFSREQPPNGGFTLFGSPIFVHTLAQTHSSPAGDDPLPEEANSGSPASAPPSNNRPERRERRLMINRESAARSRAIRRAYTAELERKIASLTEENERLRWQLNLMLLDAIAAELPKKPPFRRSSTPF